MAPLGSSDTHPQAPTGSGLTLVYLEIPAFGRHSNGLAGSISICGAERFAIRWLEDDREDNRTSRFEQEAANPLIANLAIEPTIFW